MDFATWKENFLTEQDYFIANENETINKYKETLSDYEVVVQDDYNEKVLYKGDRNVINFLTESNNIPNVKLFLVVDSESITNNMFSFIFKYEEYKVTFSTFFSEFSFEDEDEMEYSASLNAHCYFKKKYIKNDDLPEDVKEIVRKLTRIVKESIEKKSRYEEEFSTGKRSIEYDEDFNYFLNKIPFDERHLMPFSLDVYLEIIERNFNEYVNEKDWDIYSVVEYFLDGHFQNKIYEAATIYQLIKCNEKMLFEKENSKEKMIDKLKNELKRISFDLTKKQTEELILNCEQFEKYLL